MVQTYEALIKYPKISWILLYVMTLIGGLSIRFLLWLIGEIPQPGSSYLLSSTNIFNVVFANNCFLWFTPCFALISWLLVTSYANTAYTDPEESTVLPLTVRVVTRTKRSVAVIQTAKMVLVYFWVILLRVWFFGNSLFDRYLIHTGGHCVFDETSPLYGTTPNYDKCVAHAGYWEGGVKFSGHMLVLGSFSLTLIYELRNYSVIRRSNEQDGIATATAAIQISRVLFSIEDSIVYLNLFVLAMWYALFVDTAIFFHTTIEKIVGLSCAIAVPYLLYVCHCTKRYFSIL